MKKNYQKPTMKVFGIKPSQILCNSGNGELGYIPGMNVNENMNQLA